MKAFSLVAVALVFAMFLAVPQTSSAANVSGSWDVNAPGESFQTDFAQIILFLLVTEHRAAGTVNGFGISVGPLVLWTDDAGSLFLGLVNNPGRPTGMSGFVNNFAGQSGGWQATKQTAP